MRFARSAVLLLLLVLLPTPSSGATYYGFIVGVTNAPPPPNPHLLREPRVVRATDAMVYVVHDDQVRYDGDLFRYGQYWFAYDHGYWYRARSHRGPYVLMEVRRVPRAILGVPRSYWKHHPLAMAEAAKERERLAAAKSERHASKRERHAAKRERVAPAKNERIVAVKSERVKRSHAKEAHRSRGRFRGKRGAGPTASRED
jgi:hypothetical protein